MKFLSLKKFSIFWKLITANNLVILSWSPSGLSNNKNKERGCNVHFWYFVDFRFTLSVPNIISDLLQLRLTFSSRLLVSSPQGGVTYKRVEQVSGSRCAAPRCACFSEVAPRSGAAPLWCLAAVGQTRSFSVWCPLRDLASPTETTLGCANYSLENNGSWRPVAWLYLRLRELRKFEKVLKNQKSSSKKKLLQKILFKICWQWNFRKKTSYVKRIWKPRDNVSLY